MTMFAQELSRLTLQRIEFDAAAEFAKQVRRLSVTPPVDDDYLEVRHDYERALASLIMAMRNNDRFTKGNRYGLEVTP